MDDIGSTGRLCSLTYIASQARLPPLSHQPTDRSCSRGRRTGTAVGSFPTFYAAGETIATRISDGRLMADQDRIAFYV